MAGSTNAQHHQLLHHPQQQQAPHSQAPSHHQMPASQQFYQSQFPMMSRPQIGIDRLPDARRPANNEPKESMNCKSCRKRKIKCNRVKPSCEACQIFNCPCVYDAVPKKRGPKTDVLEALLKRVNGLEQRLKDEGKDGPTTTVAEVDDRDDDTIQVAGISSGRNATTKTKNVPVSAKTASPTQDGSRTKTVSYSPSNELSHVQPNESSSAFTNTLLDAYFNRLHGKPYYILDELATRQRVRDGNLPRFLINAIYAVSIQFAFHLCGSQKAAAHFSKDCGIQARSQIDVDEPSIDHLQALMLLSLAAFRCGRGKAAYMLRSHAISMALALNLHRELPRHARVSGSEREGRRRLFWSCYLMDRIVATGSKKPSNIPDESISLRLPLWTPPGTNAAMDGNYFPNGSCLPYAAGVSNASQGSGAMLVEIARVLGITNRYLAAGGVKGDSHFPWHAHSTLSRVRSDLDYWAANTQESFDSVQNLFNHSDSSILVLSKLIYHLIHCLIYRPFLPISLSELTGSGQHQSWQIDATNLCFSHANAIAELVEISKSHPIDWPPFVSYCVCTAGTVHIHGAHYSSGHEGDTFSKSHRYLTRAMAQLTEFRYTWAGSQHDLETLQATYSSHRELIKNYATNPMRFSPVFHMEDFFDRYPGSTFDGSHVTFSDVDIDQILDVGPPSNPPDAPMDTWMSVENYHVYQAVAPQFITQNQIPAIARQAKRRRTNEASLPYPSPALSGALHVSGDVNPSFEQLGDPKFHNVPPTSEPHSASHIPQTDVSGNATEQEYTTVQTFGRNAISPNFTFPTNADFTQPNHNHVMINGNDWHDQQPFYSAKSFEQLTPSGLSVDNESAHTDPDKDPFLSLLEELAQNGTSTDGGPTDLDFYLGAQNSTDFGTME